MPQNSLRKNLDKGKERGEVQEMVSKEKGRKSKRTEEVRQTTKNNTNRIKNTAESMRPISEVYNEDCLEGMKRYPDKFWDLAIVDPPFFEGVANGKFYGTGLSGTGRRRGVYKKIESWDANIPDQRFYEELCRVSKHQIIWGINYFVFSPVPVGRLVWDKKNDHSTFSNCEIASCSLIESVKIFRYKWCGFLQEPGLKKERRIHATQKPVKLYTWALDKFSRPGFKILDTHMGSQSSRIAAFSMGFDYWGWEIDASCFNDGSKRFAEQTSQIKIFNQQREFINVHTSDNAEINKGKELF